jgi:hypothetical protein
VYWSIGVIQQSLNLTNPNSDSNRYARCETLCTVGVLKALPPITVALSKVRGAQAKRSVLATLGNARPLAEFAG